MAQDPSLVTESEDLNEAAQGFADFLSREEDPESSETQPTQESPGSESDDAEASTEQAEAEDKTAETDEESEDANEDPEATTLDPATRVRVVIDGEEQEVTLEEALKGYQRQADYTRKTQEIAAQRKAQEQHFESVRGERAKYAELMTRLEAALTEVTGPEPDWAKVQQEKPEEFPALYAQWQLRQDEIKTIAQEREQAQRLVARDRAEAHQKHLQEEHGRLLEAIPEWKNPETAKSEKAAIVAYAEKAGFSREELAQVTDHRALVMLRKSMLFDKAQAAKPAIGKRIEKVIATRPGAAQQARKPVSELTVARQRLANSGSIDDAAEGFNLMFGGK